MKVVFSFDMVKKWRLWDLRIIDYWLPTISTISLIVLPGWLKLVGVLLLAVSLFLAKMRLDLGAIGREIKELDIQLAVERMISELGIIVIPAEQFDELMEDD
jgi:hypothetical protein